LSWSELFWAQHRIYKIDEQPCAHRKRYNRIEHRPYLSRSQNVTYKTENPKNTTVEITKIESSIAVLPSPLSEDHISQWNRLR
jgi:hypothetical protein